MSFWGSCVQDTYLPKEHVGISGDFTHLTRTKTVPEATVRPCCTSSAGQRVRVHFQSHTQVARVVLAAPGTTCCYGSLFTSRTLLEVWALPCPIAEDVTPDTLLKCHVSPDREVDVIKDQSQGQSRQTTPVNQSTKQTPQLRVSEPTYTSECWESQLHLPHYSKEAPFMPFTSFSWLSTFWHSANDFPNRHGPL